MCALWLHLALFAVATDASLWRSGPPPPELVPQETVSVEIVTDRLVRPLPDPSPDPAAGLAGARPYPAEPGTASLTRPPASGRGSISAQSSRTWVTATTLLAGAVMSDPRSRQASVALASLTGADKTEQICALEAMEQVRRDRPGFRPTRLAPHAFRNATRKGNTVHVAAGAVRSSRVWYEIAYRCRLDAGGRAIAGFEYALGEPIDRALWDDHGLAPVH
ncbi:DUF930 domain-containing protein [Roseibium sp. AS2]|uniref:DUF930 domain-containing protein n=1 Tax=Roseibium sp. AS2 TaxID=3135781 RepID=UPI0031735BEC